MLRRAADRGADRAVLPSYHPRVDAAALTSWPQPRPSLQPSLLTPTLTPAPTPTPTLTPTPTPTLTPNQVEKLKHQSELQEARNNPVEEELGGDDAYSEIEAMQARYLVITPCLQ